jgi:hypothetical protein
VVPSSSGASDTEKLGSAVIKRDVGRTQGGEFQILGGKKIPQRASR